MSRRVAPGPLLYEQRDCSLSSVFSAEQCEILQNLGHNDLFHSFPDSVNLKIATEAILCFVGKFLPPER